MNTPTIETEADEWDLGNSPDGLTPEVSSQPVIASPVRRSALSQAISTETRNPIRSRIANDTRVKSALAAVKTEQAKFAETLTEFESLLDPERKAAELQAKIATAGTPEEIHSAKAALAELTSPATAIAKNRAVDLANTAFYPLKDAVAHLLSEAANVAGELVVEAEAAEKDFFSTFGLSHQATAASRRAVDEQNRINAWRESLNPSRPMPVLGSRPPNAEGLRHIVSYFEQS